MFFHAKNTFLHLGMTNLLLRDSFLICCEKYYCSENCYHWYILLWWKNKMKIYCIIVNSWVVLCDTHIQYNIVNYILVLRGFCFVYNTRTLYNIREISIIFCVTCIYLFLLEIASATWMIHWNNVKRNLKVFSVLKIY